ncbi:S41 family peptidase [Gallaecimonas kandeliae]|uniref:S41 family peptidase n=1 Tax=Gallaecimonas kandeliae TaxID=3029055 RepID=UPI00264921E5|nr:S41 family peptidase [Gallaecimonas kandeliae]WKE65940.1 S41 family peptidase [Gallaecimonas kandeliae]
MKLKLLPLLGLLASPLALAYDGADCAKDIQSLPGFLLENDTGAPAHWQQKGEKHFKAAMAEALAAAAKVENAEQCQPVIRHYLKAWRHGHLSVGPAWQSEKKEAGDKAKVKADTKAKPAQDPDIPSLELLSDKTLLLTLPSFAPQYRQTVEKLLKDNHDQLAARPNWIVDVRHNGGGSDSTYGALMPWLMGAGWQDVGAEWLVTPDNIQGQLAICDRYAPGDADCKAWVDKVVTAMKKVPNGSYARTQPKAVNYEHVDKVEPKRPAKVAVLVDGQCGSSCEEFLLAVRQSYSVKLLGQRSYGSLDYSNLRAHVLPSGQFEIHYATSRSLRLPAMPVDLAGVIPDIYLPKAESDEAARAQVKQVQGWLEGGDL